MSQNEREWHDFDCGVAGGFPHSSDVCGNVTISIEEAKARRLMASIFDAVEDAKRVTAPIFDLSQEPEEKFRQRFAEILNEKGEE